MSVTAPVSVSLRVVAATPGPAFLALDAAARLPTAMYPLGTLLLVADRTGSYGTGGLAVAALSLGAAAGGPLVGALADRLGQRLVAVAATVLQASAVLSVLLLTSLPLPALLALGAVVGLSNPQMGALARTRWSVMARGRRDERAFVASAMALEGALDEVSFVLGPVLVGTLAALVSPGTPLWLALGLALVAHLGFGLHDSALPGRAGNAVEHRSPLPVARLAVLLVGLAAVGTVFGASQTGLAARLSLTGDDALTGLVYGVGAVGSAVTALLTTRLSERVPHELRIAVSGAAMTVAGLLLAAAGTPLALSGAMLLMGIALAPTLISAYALAERLAPPDWATTTMTALGTANVVGVAAGAALAGGLVDGPGPTAALLVTSVAGLVVLGAGLAARRAH